MTGASVFKISGSLRGWLVGAAGLSTVCACHGAGQSEVQLNALERIARDTAALPVEASTWPVSDGLLKIVLATSANVRDRVKDEALHPHAEVFDCDHPDQRLATLQVFYDKQGQITRQGQSAAGPAPHLVWFYIAESAPERKNLETDKLMPAYDLRVHPTEICARLIAKNMALQGFSSNEIRIPTAKVAAATTPSPESR